MHSKCKHNSRQQRKQDKDIVCNDPDNDYPGSQHKHCYICNQSCSVLEKLDTALLTPQSGETTVLDGPVYQSAETTVLSQEDVGRNNAFGVDVEISFSESTEVIE